jgi:hypothetical protein
MPAWPIIPPFPNAGVVESVEVPDHAPVADIVELGDVAEFELPPHAEASSPTNTTPISDLFMIRLAKPFLKLVLGEDA